MANASGNSSSPFRSPAMKRQMTARNVAEPTTIQRRPLENRSISGPMNGDSTTNGVRLITRYFSTWSRAASSPTEKNSEPASAIVTSVSPAAQIAWANANRPKGVSGNRSGGTSPERSAHPSAGSRWLWDRPLDAPSGRRSPPGDLAPSTAPTEASVRRRPAGRQRLYSNAAKTSSKALNWPPATADGTRIGVVSPSSIHASQPARTSLAVPDRVQSLSHLSDMRLS